jgi:hypothetical protein
VPQDLTLEAAGSYILNLGTIVRALFTTLRVESGRTMFVEGAATGTGLEALKSAARLKLSHPHLPVVLTSGFSHNLYEHGLPDNELLHKPYTVAQLEAVMRSKMDRTVH